MSYRDDLGAAQARADAAERRATALQKRLDDLEQAKRAKRSDAARASSEAVGQVPIPERFEVLLEADTLRVRWRWFRPAQHLFLLLFCVVLDVLVGEFVVETVRENGLSSLLVTSVHVGASVALTYSLVAGLLNRTTVSASAGQLQIAHAPIPWRGNRTLGVAQIRQLYVTEAPSSKDKRTTYDVCAVLDGERQLKLIKGLAELAQARYLEHAFELHLGMEDRMVADEAAKR